MSEVSLVAAALVLALTGFRFGYWLGRRDEDRAQRGWRD